MKESDLYPAVKAWLEAFGCVVYPEVHIYHRPVDVVGIGPMIIGVEMKLCLSKKVVQQAYTLCLSCDRSYVAVASRPKNIGLAASAGIGVLRVHGGSVEVLSESAHREPPSQYHRKNLVDLCSRLPTDGIGGVPNLDGVGPAQDCAKRVEAYRAVNPGASWKDIFANVPNHYANAKSMQGALTCSLPLRLRWKEYRRRERDDEAKRERNRAWLLSLPSSAN